jgi:hypothetical protein
VFYWIGWKPDPLNTPKPLEPHQAADVSLKDIGSLDEVLQKFDKDGNSVGGDTRGAIHQLLSIILKLRILVSLPVSTLPYVVKFKNYS